MKFSTGIIIFFLALIAMVAEVILYFVFGISAAVSGQGISGLAFFFVWLMVVTGAAGVAAPISGLIENLTKKENVGLYIFLPILALAGLGGAGLILTSYSATKASLAGMTANAKGWAIEEGASQMDSSKTITLSLAAAEEIQGWLNKSRPALVIRCEERKTYLYVRTEQQAHHEPGLYNEHTVRIRLDEAEPATERWRGSTDGNALFAPNPSALAERLAGAKTMRFEFTPFNASPATATFNIAGLEQRLPKVKAACKARR